MLDMLNVGKLKMQGVKVVSDRKELTANPADIHKEIYALAEDMAACTGILTAIGDETRQHLIIEMIKMGRCDGLRVGEITACTNLSRPAVSHHLRVMKDAGIVKVRHEGTKNYYYFDPANESFERLIKVLQRAVEICRVLPDRQGF